MKGIKMISIKRLHPFEGHPFKVRDNEEMNQPVESIYGGEVEHLDRLKLNTFVANG